jgi:hypothetical protein
VVVDAKAFGDQREDFRDGDRLRADLVPLARTAQEAVSLVIPEAVPPELGARQGSWVGGAGVLLDKLEEGLKLLAAPLELPPQEGP